MAILVYFKNKMITVYLFNNDDEDSTLDFITGILKDFDTKGILIKTIDPDSGLNNKMVWLSLDKIESIYEGNIESNVLEVEFKKRNRK